MKNEKLVPDKTCLICKRLYGRKRYGKRLEDLTRFLSRKYCSRRCERDSAIKADISIPGARSRALKLKGDRCEVCGRTKKLHLHHHNHDPRDNSKENTITLCAHCHNSWHWKERKLAVVPAQAREAFERLIGIK